jgi:hypothetical protein
MSNGVKPILSIIFVKSKKKIHHPTDVFFIFSLTHVWDFKGTTSSLYSLCSRHPTRLSLSAQLSNL